MFASKRELSLVLAAALLLLAGMAVGLRGVVLANDAPAGEGEPAAYLPINYSTPPQIAIVTQQFVPHALAVPTNFRLQWLNADATGHTVTETGGAFQSPALLPGERFTWQPEADGIYRYTSVDFPAMEGLVVASPNGAADWFEGGTAADAYLGFCSGCHGANRQGGIGPALRPENLTQNDLFYFETIRDGRPSTAMPSWDGILEEAEMWLMVGLLRSE